MAFCDWGGFMHVWEYNLWVWGDFESFHLVHQKFARFLLRTNSVFSSQLFFQLFVKKGSISSISLPWSLVPFRRYTLNLTREISAGTVQASKVLIAPNFCDVQACTCPYYQVPCPLQPTVEGACVSHLTSHIWGVSGTQESILEHSLLHCTLQFHLNCN